MKNYFCDKTFNPVIVFSVFKTLGNQWPPPRLSRPTSHRFRAKQCSSASIPRQEWPDLGILFSIWSRQTESRLNVVTLIPRPKNWESHPQSHDEHRSASGAISGEVDLTGHRESALMDLLQLEGRRFHQPGHGHPARRSNEGVSRWDCETGHILGHNPVECGSKI